MNHADVIERFRAAIVDAGLNPPEHILADGALHRFGTNGRGGDASGWYVLHGDGLPAGAFGCWRSDVSLTWRASVEREATAKERAEQRERMARIERQRKAEQEQRYDEARRRAAELWDAARPAPDDHVYLARKVVKAHGLRVHDGKLLVPMRDCAGVLHSFQMIGGDGHKLFMKGGRVRGCHFIIGEPRNTILVCEGFATGATLHEATGHAVVIAFNCGNLEPVARAIREAHPAARLLVAADDDHLTDGNPGLAKASAAAKAVSGSVAIPKFAEPRPDSATDFNDLAALSGIEEVRRQITAALPVDAPLIRPRAELVLTEDELNSARLTPRCVVDRYLYADVAMLASPGGVGKTTLLLREAISIVLGTPLWGLEVQAPGWVLFISKEDQREQLAARLREIMAALDLSPDERRRVLAGVILLDVTGTPTKLTRVADGNVIWEQLADRIVETYSDDPPAVVIFDPLVSFGASEGMVNDNEQALVEVARAIVRGLKCCVRYVHHVGKVNAREGAVDQYAGRGGSAMPDGCRMVSVLAAWNGKDALPVGCTIDADAGVFRLERPKLSYAPPGLPTLWIRRRGFVYDHFAEFKQTPDEAAAARGDQLERFLVSCVTAREYHTATTLDAQQALLKMSRAEIRAALGMLQARGRVVDADLPPELRRGGRKVFLCPAELAAGFGGVAP